MEYKDIIIAFNLTPEDAIKFFKKLGIKPSLNWKETLAAILNNAFAIAGVKNMDSIMDAKQLIEKAIEDGTDLDDFKKKIKEDLQLRNWHADLVVTQNVANSYNSGSFKRQEQSKDLLPYVRFILGARMHHTPGCLWLVNNKVAIRIDDPLINKFYPSRHFRCATIAKSVSEKWVDDNGYKVRKGSDIPKIYQNSKGFNTPPNAPMMDRFDFTKYPKQLFNKFKELVK